MSEFHFSPRPNRAGEIAWRAWSREAFDEARAADKPVLLSLSAVWCHWCHVMDETSYSDPGVIDKINAAFIPVRVDADQRPDINARYNAGGWPTTAFLAPDGEILTAQTYVPPDGMRSVIEIVLDAYGNRRDEITAAIAQRRERRASAPLERTNAQIDESILRTARASVEDAFDEDYGGFGSEPKFPHIDVLEFTALEYERTHDARLERILSATLSAMARGGMYDHIEGGFFRYSTTRDWSVPHFEKMAEDHAGFIRLYAWAWRVLGLSSLRETLVSTIAYVRTTLRDPRTGLFAGSQDADETYYSLPLEQRRTMAAPYIDRTSYTNWSAALGGAFTVAGAALDDDALVAEGLQTLDTIAGSLLDEDGLCYHFLPPGGRPTLRGQLTDQASYLRALLDAYDVCGEPRLLARAKTLAQTILLVFSQADDTLADHVTDEPLGLLVSAAAPLPENATVANALLRLGVILQDDSSTDRALRILRAFVPRYAGYRTFAAPYASAVARALYGGSSVTIVGAPQATSAFREVARRLPDPLLVAATFAPDDPLVRERGLAAQTPVAYLCHGRLCGAPVHDAANLRDAFDMLHAAQSGR
ncbi:MAG TPA: DUF255 domain-containing protein [Candidatus Acidoferrales bacterium]|nr:DUF255 domain-containing protein [Candidatus Acidoferrales bacterium]